MDINQDPTSPETTLFLFPCETLLVYNRTPLQEEMWKHVTLGRLETYFKKDDVLKKEISPRVSLPRTSSWPDLKQETKRELGIGTLNES